MAMFSDGQKESPALVLARTLLRSPLARSGSWSRAASSDPAPAGGDGSASVIWKTRDKMIFHRRIRSSDVWIISSGAAFGTAGRRRPARSATAVNDKLQEMRR